MGGQPQPSAAAIPDVLEENNPEVRQEAARTLKGRATGDQ
jgi:hypothetical protein